MHEARESSYTLKLYLQVFHALYDKVGMHFLGTCASPQVMLMVFMQLVNRQVTQVNYLRQAARAGSRVMQVAQLCRYASL